MSIWLKYLNKEAIRLVALMPGSLPGSLHKQTET